MKSATMAIFLMLLGGALSACGPRGCPGNSTSVMNHNDLETSALYNRGPRPLLPDAWTENPGLELFVLDILPSGGVSSLAKYGMQCSTNSAEVGCKDCVTCTKSFRDYRLGVTTFYYTCEDYGEMQMRVDIGPGLRVKAMTYWQTTPLAREIPRSQANKDGSPTPR